MVAVSSATGEGLDELRRAIFAAVPAAETRVERGDCRGARRARVRGRARRLSAGGGRGGFDVEREDDAFRVLGRGVEMLVARHDLSDLEALAYLEQRLREIGVIAALERARFSPGDEVRIGAEAFDLDPR